MMNDQIIVSPTMLDYMKKKCDKYKSNYSYHRFHYSCGDGYDFLVGVTCVKEREVRE